MLRVRQEIARSCGVLRNRIRYLHAAIGPVSIEIKPPASKSLVPHGFLPSEHTEWLLGHLQWMMRKDILGQDMFLIGPPGPERRRLALAYCELTQREVEYLAISRDTTDGDLKQRREVKGGSVVYVDQGAVRAAQHGRVLILDGIEKAERNVLPLLNNLLENRTMPLDDGRMLTAASQYDALVDEHGEDAVERWRLVRVSPDFRIIVLGLPVPPFPGSRLDPPFRSRFQSRNIDVRQRSLTDAAAERLNIPGQFGVALQASGVRSLHPFPAATAAFCADMLATFPEASVETVVARSYPWDAIATEGEASKAVEVARKHILRKGSEDKSAAPYDSVTITALGNGRASAKFSGLAVKPVTHTLGVGAQTLWAGTGKAQAGELIETDELQRAFVAMAQDHALGADLCLVGGKGVGKSALARYFGRRLGYAVDVLPIYRDMSTRDLFMRRTTSPTGDTAWQPSPLLTAAIEGHVCVLDGVDRLPPGALSVLQTLIQDRTATLPNGARLLAPERPGAPPQVTDGATLATSLATLSVAEGAGLFLRVHPTFRVIALAHPPTQTNTWLDAEALTLFRYHYMHGMPVDRQAALLSSLFPKVPRATIDKLSVLTTRLAGLAGGALSTRQLIRICRRVSQYPGDLRAAVERAWLVRFMPLVEQRQYEAAFNEVLGPERGTPHAAPEISEDRNYDAHTCLRIGGVVCEVPEPVDAALVPRVPRFRDIAAHRVVLQGMLKDFMNGESLLLIGPQGVGKNMLTDRFLELTKRPRQYIQLHRDSTVMSLTMQVSFDGGRLRWGDSPLVQAVRHGHVLVVDEADKAPLEVVAVLKALVEDRNMLLADGRRIVDASHEAVQKSDPTVIPIHRDFAMIVLANRPGFPFLGNDFFRECGDLFALHAIGNPDRESEVELLRAYAPPDTVDSATLATLSATFDALRSAADQGLLSYPYSARELVSIVKHAGRFPEDGLASALRNVFDFDQYDDSAKSILVSTFRRHGLPLGLTAGFDVRLAPASPLPRGVQTETWTVEDARKKLGVKTVALKGKSVTWDEPREREAGMDAHDRASDAGAHVFSEHVMRVVIPASEAPRAMATLGGAVFVMVGDPPRLLCYGPGLTSYRDLTVDRDAYGWAPALAALPKSGRLILATDGEALLINPETFEGERVPLPPLEGSSPRNRWWSRGGMPGGGMGGEVIFASELARSHGLLLMYARNGDRVHVIYDHPADGQQQPHARKAGGALSTVQFPTEMKIQHVAPVTPSLWVVHGEGGTVFHVSLDMSSGTLAAASLAAVQRSGTFVDGGQRLCAWTHPAQATLAVSSSRQAYLHLLSAADLSKGVATFTTFPRAGGAAGDASAIRVVQQGVMLDNAGTETLAHIAAAAEVVHVSTSDAGHVLEVVDPTARTFRRVAVPEDPSPQRESDRLKKGQPPSPSGIVDVCALPEGRLAVLLASSVLHVFRLAPSAVHTELQRWRAFVGSGVSTPDALKLRMEAKAPSRSMSGPKHGKIDPNNAPHVGGNQWHGGTGGADTAGLGGAGGPYRVDAGHNVHQVPQAMKDAVPPEVREAARKMARAAYEERLSEIGMAPHDAALYESYRSTVARQIREMQVLLASLQAKDQERVWLKHQTTGEIDENKLVEGIVGDRNVYKRRGRDAAAPDHFQTKPKKLSFVMDISGSMYRFNGLDRRLDRVLSTTVMLMEGLKDTPARIRYNVVGHSGESPAVPLVPWGEPPKNERERLTVIQKMAAHTQFCDSGDFTLEAAKTAIKDIAQGPADERLVFVVSDANLARYGISPVRLNKALTSDPDVKAYCIFLASLGDEAEQIRAALPAGRGFVCYDTADLPRIFREIFESTVFKE